MVLHSVMVIWKLLFDLHHQAFLWQGVCGVMLFHSDTTVVLQFSVDLWQ
jgi:hypothetical protein